MQGLRALFLCPESSSGWTQEREGHLVILPKIRDPRFITVRRGGTLEDDDHHRLAVWAADCAEHVLHHFERARPTDDRPRRAIDLGRAWARGEITWAEARTAAGHANAAARDLTGAARHAAYAAGQAAAVGHVAAHELGAAAYAVRAARAAAPGSESEAAGRVECQWQRARLPREIRELNGFFMQVPSQFLLDAPHGAVPLQYDPIEGVLRGSGLTALATHAGVACDCVSAAPWHFRGTGGTTAEVRVPAAPMKTEQGVGLGFNVEDRVLLRNDQATHYASLPRIPLELPTHASGDGFGL